MQLWGTFNIDGGVMTARIPSNASEPLVWQVNYQRDSDGLFYTENIPMTYRPVFGPDVSDVNTLNARIEEIIVQLGLNDDQFDEE